MVNKIGVVATAVASGALGLAGVSQVNSLNNESILEKQEARHTKTIEELQDLRINYRGMQESYAKLDAAHKVNKDEMSKQADLYAINFKAFQEAQKHDRETISKYTEMLQAARGDVSALKNDFGSMSGRVGTVEGNQKELKSDITSLTGKTEEASKKIDGIKTDNQIRTEVYEKRAPSVVEILFKTKDGAGSVIGSIIQDKEGKYGTVSVGHGFQNRIPDTDVRIVLRHKIYFDVKSKAVHSLGLPGRDCSLVEFQEEWQQKLLKRLNIEGIPIAPATEEPKLSRKYLVIGENWEPYSATVAGVNSHWHGWEFEKTDYTMRESAVKEGDSGGPLLDEQGRMRGMVCSIPRVIATGAIVKDKKVTDLIRSDVRGALTARSYFISAPDIQRALRGFGFNAGFSDEDRNFLVRRDIGQNRLYLAMPPIPGPSIHSLLGSIPIADLANIEPYLLKDNK